MNEQANAQKDFTRSPLLLVAAGVALVFVLVWSVSRVGQATERLDIARLSAVQASDAAAMIAAARESELQSTPSSQPDEDVLALLAQAMNDAGLPRSRQQQVASAGQVRIDQQGLGASATETVEDRVTIRLQPMTSSEVRSLLQAWQGLSSDWYPVSLVMESANRSGGDPVYSAALEVAIRYVRAEGSR